MGIASTIGLITGDTNVQTPSPSSVGGDYMSLLNAYLASQPAVLASEQNFQPQYTQLGLANQSMVRGQNVTDATNLGPAILAALKSYNPGMAGLLDSLTSQAQSQLGQNGALDPAMMTRLQQNVRSSQAARGLGYGPADAAQENYYVTQTQEQRRAQNQALASQVAGLNQSAYRDPFSILLGYSGGISPGPSITSPSSMFSLMGLPYQGALSASTSSAANRAGLYRNIDASNNITSLTSMGSGTGMAGFLI